MKRALAIVLLVVVLGVVAAPAPRGDAAATPRCALGGGAVVRTVLAIKGSYRQSGFDGEAGGRPWEVCQYVSGSLAADKPTSLLVGVFPLGGRFSSRDWTLGQFCAQAFLTAIQATPRACALLRRAQEAKDPTRKVQLLSAALSQVGEVAKVRAGIAGNPAFLYDPTLPAAPGSDAWVYLRSTSTIVHSHCTRASNPELRADDCAIEAARVVAARAAGKK